MSSNERLARVAVVAILAAAAALRLWGLGHPATGYFDETYYAGDACLYALDDPATCDRSEEITEVHPPLGKELIGLGIRLFGYEPWAWRIVPAVAGIATVLILYAVARRLTDSAWAGALAASFLAIDFLHIVQSRIAMLDVFLPLFGLSAVLCSLMYGARAKANPAGRGSILWIVAAGVLAGLAAAVKWSGGLFIALVFFVLVRDLPPQWTKRMRYALVVVLAAAIAYVAAFAPRVAVTSDACPELGGTFVGRFVDQHRCMAAFHRTLEASHFYQSPAWSWPLLKRPVSYYFCAGGDCRPAVEATDVEEVLAIGHPLLWVVMMGAVALTMWRGIRRNSREVAGYVGAWGFLILFLPWIAIDLLSERDAIFSFYLLPTLPFAYVALAALVEEFAKESPAGKAAAALFVGAGVAALAFYLPLLTARPLDVSAWHLRVAPFSACRGAGIAVFTPNVEPTTTDPEANKSAGQEPPPGWCWI